MDLERTVGLRPGRLRLAPRPPHRDRLDPPQARGDGRRDPGRDRRRRGRPPSRRATCSPATASRPGCCRSTSAPPTAGSSITWTTCWRRPARPTPSACPAETLILDRYGLARELSLPLDADALRTTSWSRATASTTACCTIPSTTAARPRASSTSPRAGCPIPADKIARAARRLPAPAARRRCARRPSCCGCRSRPDWHEPGRDDGARCCCGRWSARRCRRCRRRSGWRCASSRPAAWSPTSTSSRASSATPATPTCPSNDAGARRRRLDRPHRLRHPRAAPHAAAQEGPRPAAREQATDAERATACAGQTRTSSTTTAGRSRSPRAASRA